MRVITGSFYIPDFFLEKPWSHLFLCQTVMCESASSLYLRTLKRNVICLILLNSVITMWRRMFWRIVLRPQLSVVIRERNSDGAARFCLFTSFGMPVKFLSNAQPIRCLIIFKLSVLTRFSQLIFSTWVVGCTEPCYLLGIHWDDATTRALSVEMMQHDDVWSVSIF